MQQMNYFVAWIDWSGASDFRIYFGKTLVAFYFDEKQTKHCTNDYVISRVKRLSLLQLCCCSSAFNFKIWFRKWKNAV